MKVPYGRTTTYRELAIAAGSPGGSRAAGMANAKNPIAIFIPCHRVIGSNGKLVGFGGGLGSNHGFWTWRPGTWSDPFPEIRKGAAMPPL